MISRKVAYVLRKFRLIFAYVLGKRSIFGCVTRKASNAEVDFVWQYQSAILLCGNARQGVGKILLKQLFRHSQRKGDGKAN